VEPRHDSAAQASRVQPRKCEKSNADFTEKMCVVRKQHKNAQEINVHRRMHKGFIVVSAGTTG